MAPHEPIFAPVDALDVEFLARLYIILEAEFGGKHVLAFGRNGGCHDGKITSYIAMVKGRRAKFYDCGARIS